jgi:hypothetical protein
MHIHVIESMVVLLALHASSVFAEVDQRCVSVQSSVCNSTLARCQCAPAGRANATDNAADQQRRCTQDCHLAYQSCLADASRSCYR